MTEIWRDIKGYEGLYQVSNLGNVRRLVGFRCRNERIIKPRKKANGYLQVILQDNGIKKCVHIHRLVAEAFIPNTDNLPEVNHIDEDKTNNRVSNLEWCTRKYNAEYSLAKPVNQYTLSGEFVKQWVSTRAIERQCGVHQQNIWHCCKGKIKSAYGFKWYYVDDPVQYIDRPLW